MVQRTSAPSRRETVAPQQINEMAEIVGRFGLAMQFPKGSKIVSQMRRRLDKAV